MTARPVLAGVAGLVLAAATLGSLAAPAATADTAGSTYGEPRTVCTITDERLPEISGATMIDGELTVANDKGARYYRLDSACDVTTTAGWRREDRSKSAAKLLDRDIEALAVGPDGTVWMVDSGGNREPRDAISLLGLTPDGDAVEIAFAYPDGDHDTEAAVITPDLQLVLLTKEAGSSTVFTARIPALDPDADVTGPVDLRDAGQIDLDSVTDPTSDSAAALVTDAALSPDGQHLAVRTPVEILEWTLDGTDVAAELVSQRPARVAQVEQRQGEAVVYSADGSELLALSEQLPSPVLAIDIERTAAEEDDSAGVGVPTWGYGLLGGGAGLLVLVLLAGLRRRPALTAPEVAR